MAKFKKFSKANRPNTNKQVLPKSRKELRKEKRKAKKERKNQHYQKKFQKVVDHNTNSNTVKKVRFELPKSKKDKASESSKEKNNTKEKENSDSYVMQMLNHKNEMLEQSKLEKEMKKMRKRQLVEDNKQEDIVIKKLEKQLKLNKRKSKKLPQSFVDDGLDYLLELCDSDKTESAIKAEMNLHEMGSEFEEDFAVVTGEKRQKKEKGERDIIDHKENCEPDSTSCSDMEDENNSEQNNFNEDDDILDSEFGSASEYDSESAKCDEESDSNDEENATIKKLKLDKSAKYNDKDSESDEDLEDERDERCDEEYKQDIYGRKRDKCGNVVTEGKYVPPHVKAQQLAKTGNSERLLRLRKQVKGLLNRLAESNMHNIVSQLDSLYMENSRNDMNETLTKLMFESIIQPTLTPKKLILEHTVLISALHANVGTEVGAHFLQAIVQKFDSTYDRGIDVGNKEVDNILLTLSHLYSFKMFHAVLIFGVMDRLIGDGNLGEKEVELLLLVLQNVGFSLRKDNPLGLKNIILRVQNFVNGDSSLVNQSRVRFMMDMLLAIKNNNTSKIPQYDPTDVEHLKKLLKTLVHKGNYITELNISFEDLLKAPERGRWWVVGSAWSGEEQKLKNPEITVKNNFEHPYLELAKKHRMSTDARRNIFCIIMSAEDYLDAFEKLLRLGLKGPQEQGIIHVIIHCALQEKKFNPYYAYLVSHFCTADRKFQMILQYHIWDRLKELKDLKNFQITNLAQLLAHLFLEKALPLSVLKVVEFASLEKPTIRLLRQLFLKMLLHNNKEAIAESFERISHSPKLHMFRESVRLFFHHFILKNIDENSDQMILLNERVRLAEMSLNKIAVS